MRLYRDNLTIWKHTVWDKRNYEKNGIFSLNTAGLIAVVKTQSKQCEFPGFPVGGGHIIPADLCDITQD